MPKTPIDYTKTIIYKIICLDLEIKDNYVGSTTSFLKRKQQHNKKLNSKYIQKLHLI